MFSLKSFVTVGVPTGPQEASLRFLTASEEGDFFQGIQLHSRAPFLHAYANATTSIVIKTRASINANNPSL